MLMIDLFEALSRTGKGDTAVVGWGRGMGHKGHMYLASSVITKAKSIGADPYFVVSRTVGKDDPITPDEKLAIYRKVFPGHAHIFQTATDEIPDLTRVLANLNQQGYKNVVAVLGADQVKAFQYLKQYNGKPNKAGDIPYDFDSLEVISRQETGDPSAGEEGPRATPMRNILMDPNATSAEQFMVWRDAMSPEISDKEVRELMNKARERMSAMAAEPAKKPKVKAVKESADKNQPESERERILLDLFKKFFPLAMKELGIKDLPPIELTPHVVTHGEQPTFGRFVNDEKKIYLCIENRHPVDILRTLAHELVHYKQFLNNELNHHSGKTGSPQENEAHAVAGVIMRNFNKANPDAIDLEPIDLK